MGLSQSLRGPGRRASALVSTAPLLFLVAYPALTGGVERWGLGLALVSTAFLLALPGALGWWRSPDHQRREDAWRLVSSMLGIPIAVVFVAVVVSVPVAVVALTMALVLIGELYLTDRRWQLLVGTWTVAGWVVAVRLAGEQDAAALWLHAVGAGLVLVVTLRTVRALHRALDDERDAAREAQQRARVVRDLLAAEDLTPQVVVTNARRALRHLGFDVVLIRRYDTASRRLELLSDDTEGHALAPTVVTAGSGPWAQVVTSREPLELRDQPLHSFLGSAPGGESERHLGSSRVPLALLVPVLDDDDEVLGVVSVASLRCPQRAAPVELVTSLAARFGQLLARARAFQADAEMVSLLRDLDLRTQDVVATVSHELRTPLTVIAGLSRTMEQRWMELDDPKRMQLCARIEDNADRLHGMITSLLQTSAFEQDDLRANLAPTDLTSLVLEVVERMRSAMIERTIEAEVASDLTVIADRQLLLHVLENLLSNAGKHTPPGTAIRIQARCHGDSVTVVVRDEGPGIPASELPLVQERFYRGGDPNQRTTRGLGLGLALVQRLLDAHDSDLRLTSDGGLNAAFDLPCAKPTA